MTNRIPLRSQVGSLESDIMEASSRPTDIGSVVNDLDKEEEDNVPLENKEIYLTKINKRIKEYTIKELNPPREGKRLLVLDIDYTIFDHRSVAENGGCAPCDPIIPAIANCCTI